MSVSLVTALAVLGVALIFLGQRLSPRDSNPIQERLAQLSTPAHDNLDGLERQQPFRERVLRPFIRSLASALARRPRRRARERSADREDRTDVIARRLALAGYPYRWTPADFLGTKVFAALVIGGVLFFFLSISRNGGFAWLFGAVGALFGWFGPDLLLRTRTRARQRQIERVLPDALDLLVISVEAGLGFDAAMQRLVDKRSDALALELARVLAEMRVGRSRRDAFKDLASRTQVQNLTNFITAILQAEQLGVSVTRVLTVQAEQMRVLRRQRAEEKAAQIQLKMLFPLAIFIFPALCVVILGPIWPSIAATNAPGV